MTEPMRQLGPHAYLLAGGGLAAQRVVLWLTVEEGSAWAALTDAGYVLLVSLIAALFVGAARTVARPRVSWSLLSLVSLGMGAYFLHDDLGGFSHRQTAVPAPFAFYGLATLIAALLVGGVWVAGLAHKTEIRGLFSLAAVTLSVGHSLVLPNDYWGIHLFSQMIALAVLGASWESHEPRRSLPESKVLFAGAGVLAIGLVVAPVPAAAEVSLANTVGAPFARAFGQLLRTTGSGPTLTDRSEWFRSRQDAPDVPPSSDNPLGGAPIVVLITVDALRADVVASGDYDELLPTLGQLRREGIHFTQARSPGTLTKTALSATFLGTYFSQQYWSPLRHNEMALTVHADETSRFPEFLREAGVRTANFRGVSWLRNTVVFKGFKYEPEIKYSKSKSYYAPASAVFERLLPYLKKVSALDPPEATFIYSHLADPHAPYDLGRLKKGSPFDKYLSEVELVDEHLKKLVRLLSKEQVRDRALLIVSADHGEAFGEHKSKTHGTTMYDEVLRVPLIMWRPTGVEPRVVEDLVSLIDAGPTVLDAFGLPTPGSSMGQSLLPYLSGDSPRLTRPIIAETRLMRSLVTEERLKLIVDTRSGRQELYDLTDDPSEEKNLAHDEESLKDPLAQMNTFFEVHTIKREGYEPPFVK